MLQERSPVFKGRTIAAAPSRTFPVGIMHDVLLPPSLAETLFVLQAVGIVVPLVVVEAGPGRIPLVADVAVEGWSQGSLRGQGSLRSQCDIEPSAVKGLKCVVHGDVGSLWTGTYVASGHVARGHVARGVGGSWRRRWLGNNLRR